MSVFEESNNFCIPEIKIPEHYFITGFGGSTKGYSKKAFYQDKWYKVSAGTFNAQAEVIASRLAKHTSLTKYIVYNICKVNGEWGTMSDDFIKNRRRETIKSLHAKLLQSPIEDIESQITGKDLFNYIRKFIQDSLNLDITEDVNLMLRFDAIILNEDRHFRNFEFVEIAENKWEMIPPFDFDCSFFSQVEDWNEIKTYKPKSQPFFTTHKEQIKFMNTLSDKRLILSPFNPSEIVKNVWDDAYQLGKPEILFYLESIKGGLII